MKIPNNWTFKDKEVAAGFDTHVRGQLPWYDLCTEAIEHIVRNYLPESGVIYDIGASTGNINIILNDLIKERECKYIGIDSSIEMINKFKGNGSIQYGDAVNFDYQNFDVCVCFLILMFIPVQHQKHLIDKLISKMNVGGCIILVDKCQPKSGYISTVLSRLAIREKMKFEEPDAILKKELSLSGVQRPIRENISSIGVEFFRFGDFAGWVIEKGI